MKVTRSLKDESKEQIMRVLKDGYMSTRVIARAVKRSWEFTNKMLEELAKEGRVERLDIAKIQSWRRVKR